MKIPFVELTNFSWQKIAKWLENAFRRFESVERPEMPEMHLQNFEKLQRRKKSERFHSVCAKRNIVYGVAVTSLGESPHHLRQRLNIVHLCRAGWQ